LSAARLVTLSACETGITDVFRGSAEEYVGLPAGFMLAGVPCVVSSLWSVPDISTALLMERFYRNHLKGEMDFSIALQEAQAWVRRLEAREVAEYAETCYRQSKPAQQAELLKYIRHYHYQAEADPTARPFAHPYYWAAFTVNGM
jgi:CHAT domain-containing protein